MQRRSESLWLLVRLLIRATCCSLTVITATVGCASRSSSPHVVNLFEAERAVERYLSDGRYDADFRKVVAEAQAFMERRAPHVTRPAIVLDIDETSLSNWPAYRANGWARIVNDPCALDDGPCGLRAWQESAQAKALEPTLTLARRAKTLGVSVFFITGRPAALRTATERNLREQGYTWDDLVLLAPNAKFASAADFKAPERRKIAERGYTILLTMGDQDSDLKGGYAERTFKLPNPVYFLP
jgi:predicted secreted acid phosphatase